MPPRPPCAASKLSTYRFFPRALFSGIVVNKHTHVSLGRFRLFATFSDVFRLFENLGIPPVCGSNRTDLTTFVAFGARLKFFGSVWGVLEIFEFVDCFGVFPENLEVSPAAGQPRPSEEAEVASSVADMSVFFNYDDSRGKI